MICLLCVYMIEFFIMKKFGVFLVFVVLFICKGKFIYNFEVIGSRVIIDVIKVKFWIFF